MKEYIGTYPGIPVTVENNGDVTFHCGSIEKAYKFVELLPKFEITRKQYKCENCNKDFVAEIEYEYSEEDIKEWYATCPYCKYRNWLGSQCYYR